ncbi:MAG: hypothetical protein U9Q06_01235 [Nanoarchaeota archaeon]|nr:hypothetical protein [Nanoarchaeota archaeon]
MIKNKTRAKRISALTIILIVLALGSLYFTYNSYFYYKHEAKLYSDMIYAEPRESALTSEEWTQLYDNELNKYVLLKSMDTNTQILDGDRQNMYLSYSHYARNEYFLNRLASIIFIILSIFSWKFDRIKGMKNG